jgi:hypothetical protein
MKSLVLIIPTELRDSANQLGDALGMGPNNYSVPLSTGSVITHYGLHAWSDEAFIEMLETGTLPEGVEFPDLQEVLDALIVSVQPDSTGHFDNVLQENNLTRYEPDSTNP